MRERLTARVLLLDPQDRLLLLRGRLSSASSQGAWFMVGGEVEPGETVEAAAAREIQEETGLAGVEVGPVVWLREGPLPLDPGGAMVLLKERYLVARCAGGALCSDGWTELERSLIEEMRWWSQAEIAQAREPIYPATLAEFLPDILAGRLPEAPVPIPWP